MLNAVIQVSLAALGCLLFGAKVKRSKAKDDSQGQTTKANLQTVAELQIAERAYHSLKFKYLSAYLLAVFGDWLQVRKLVGSCVSLGLDSYNRRTKH